MKKAEETILEPDLPICDPHHHFWKRDNSYYGKKEFLTDISNGHNIHKTVFIECKSMYRRDGPEAMKPVGETEFVVDEVKNSPIQNQIEIAAGIIGFADLTLGDAVKPVIEAHIAAGNRRFHGIRNMASWDEGPEIMSLTPNPQLYLDPVFKKGFACLKQYNLSFDAWIYHTQLMQVVDLANNFPDTPIILDHIGTPLGIGKYSQKRQIVFDEWRQGIAALSRCPNVYLKFGGLGMPLCGITWNKTNRVPDSTDVASAIKPYFDWCIEKFGVGRCMLESNFPMDKQSYSYNILWNAFKRISKDLSKPERSYLFYNTAVNVYRLNSSG